METINEQLEVGIKDEDVEYTSRTGKSKKDNKKLQSIIIKCVQYSGRKKVFQKKKSKREKSCSCKKFEKVWKSCAI